jgi:hypothetical protein
MGGSATIMIRKWMLGMTVAAALQAMTAGLPPAGAAPPALLGQVTIKQAGARNWVVEGLVVVVLSGVAIFAICKSSRRV